MAFVTNPMNFPNLTSKATPTGSDLVMIADVADSDKIKQATVSSIQAASSGITAARAFGMIWTLGR